jgi:tRNA(Ile2) C34 agmatinyltransferase TiaS
MSAAATAAVCEEQVTVRHGRRPCTGRGSVTLGQLLTRTHNAVLSVADADCPVCGGTLTPHGLEGHCQDCGSRLA